MYREVPMKKQRTFIRTFILLVLIAATVFTLYQHFFNNQQLQVTVGEKAPDFILTDLQGKNISCPIIGVRGYF